MPLIYEFSGIALPRPGFVFRIPNKGYLKLYLIITASRDPIQMELASLCIWLLILAKMRHATRPLIRHLWLPPRAGALHRKS